MIKLNTVYKAGKQEVKFQEKEPGLVYAEYGDETVEGKMEGNTLKGIFHNKKVNVTGLMELTFHESGFEGRWKKGIEPGELKQKWNAVLIEDKNPTNESKNGYHIFEGEDNIRYEGEWENDEFISGKAEYVDEDGVKVIEEGEFKDLIITSGKITYENGTIEEGTFDEEGVLHGQGKQTYLDEDGVKVIEEGIFEQGNLKEGKITWSDGNTASGTFDEELELNGKGIYTWENGDFQDGTWVHGEFKDGKAKITHDDGEILEGMMKDGEWVEEIKDVLDSEMPLMNRTFQVGDKVKIPNSQRGELSLDEGALKMINNARILDQDFVYINCAIATFGRSSKSFIVGEGIPKNVKDIWYFLSYKMETDNGEPNFRKEDLIFYGEENTYEIKEMTSEEIKSLESSGFKPEEIDLSINLNLPKLKMSSFLDQHETIYYGEVEDGLPKGKGVLVFSYDEILYYENFNESLFDGNIFLGIPKIYGDIIYKFRDGSILKGFLTSEIMSFGQINFSDGSKYIGKLGGKEGGVGWPPRPNGEGSYFNQEDKLVYSGTFSNGKYTDSNGESLALKEIDEAPKLVMRILKSYSYIGYEKNDGGIIGVKHGMGSLENLESSIKFNGEFENNLYHGVGSIEHGNGQTYTGQWKKDKMNGKGIYTWPNGEEYRGDYLNNDRHGKGTYTWPDGQQYIGDWIEGKRHGNGIHSFPDGRKYEGLFTNDKWNGKGTYTWSDGQKYEGEFINGNYHGFGKLIESNGSWKEGTWENDVFISGKAYIIYEGGDTYHGDYSNNTYNGKGIYTWTDGKKYEGECSNGKWHGKGKYTCPDGQKYEGEFINGNYHGFGKLIESNGSWKQGTWENDEFISGKGFWILDSGDTYEGERSQGAWNGTGKYIWASGDSYEGGFKDGKILGKTKHQSENERRQSEEDARKYREEMAQREKDELERKKSEEKKKKQELEEKSKSRYFSIQYSIKLKEDKHQTFHADGFLDAIISGGWSKTEKTHGKGQLIQRTIRVYHEGQSLSNSSAKNYIMRKDADVLSGMAGSSTIIIIKIK